MQHIRNALLNAFVDVAMNEIRLSNALLEDTTTIINYQDFSFIWHTIHKYMYCSNTCHPPNQSIIPSKVVMKLPIHKLCTNTKKQREIEMKYMNDVCMKQQHHYHHHHRMFSHPEVALRSMKSASMSSVLWMAYLNLSTHTYKHIHTYIHTYIYIYTYIYIHTLKEDSYNCTNLVSAHTHIHTYSTVHTVKLHTYMHKYTIIHTYIHTYIHTH